MLIQEQALHPITCGFCWLLRTSPKFLCTAKAASFPRWHLQSPPCPDLELLQPGQAALLQGRGSTLLAGNFIFLSANRNKYPWKKKKKKKQ